MTIALVVLAIGAVAAAYVGVMSSRFNDHTEALRTDMIVDQRRSRTGTTALPEIVRAYAIRAGGQVGNAPVFHARHEATLATAKGAPAIPITADQWTGTVAPGIVWSARGTMNGMPVSVVDAYVAGQGELSARIAGAFQMAGGAGPDYDKGVLMRYLSELPVYPDAILNNTALAWRQIDAVTVEVRAKSSTGEAAVRFIFDRDGARPAQSAR